MTGKAASTTALLRVGRGATGHSVNAPSSAAEPPFERGNSTGTAPTAASVGFSTPFGDTLTSQWLAMWARRHMHEFGTTEEHLGHIAVTFRDHATKNPNAPLRDPITLEDYFASRIITTPFRLLDCFARDKIGRSGWVPARR